MKSSRDKWSVSKKSSILFGGQVDDQTQSNIMSILSIVKCNGEGKYLGIPYLVKRSKKQILQFVMDGVWKKLQGWKEKLLSQVGKEILIKSVLQVIPTYDMQRFLLRKTLYKEITAMIRQFWLGRDVMSKSICWKDWTTICKAKEYRGMGF